MSALGQAQGRYAMIHTKQCGSFVRVILSYFGFEAGSYLVTGWLACTLLTAMTRLDESLQGTTVPSARLTHVTMAQ